MIAIFTVLIDHWKINSFAKYWLCADSQFQCFFVVVNFVFQFHSLHCLIKSSIQPLYMKNNHFLTTVTASKALSAHYTPTYSMIGIFSTYVDLQIKGRDVTNQKHMNALAQIWCGTSDYITHAISTWHLKLVHS